MNRILKITPQVCTGCNLCALACSWVQSACFDLNSSAVKVLVFGEQLRFSPTTCCQCEASWCMASCPVGAIRRDEVSGARVIVDSACIGCGLCVLTCPFGSAFYSPFLNRAVKCDLCSGDPACARFCPTDALCYVESNALSDPVGSWAERYLSAAIVDEEGGLTL
jgi:Fe-S-cluster-containing hydrogenase component 2